MDVKIAVVIVVIHRLGDVYVQIADRVHDCRGAFR